VYQDVMRWTSFGTWKRIKCDIDINRVFRTNDTVFYDPYFIDSDGKYYPMPVVVENYRDASGATPNADGGDYYYQETFGSTAVLTRRFFIVDNLSGRTSTYYSSPDVVRVIERAGILMHIRNPDNPGKIYPPRLVIKYHEVDVKGLDANTKYERETQFGIAYAMETDTTFGDAFTVYFSLCVALSVPTFGLRGYRLLRGNQGQPIDGILVGRIVGVLLRSVSHVFGVAYILLAFYFYIAFKMQGSVEILMPNDEMIAHDLYLYWAISFVGVFLGTLFVIFNQMCADIFFIDWEATPGRVHSSNSNTTQVSVSTWRSLFVANEFARLQTERIINFNLTCIWVLFFLTGVPTWTEPYYNASCNTPDGSLLEYCSEWARSGLLRVAVDAFFWCVVAAWQVLFNKFLYQHFYKHPSLQLLDAMSLANISAWILCNKYMGFYLHGQSPLQHADTTLSDFTELLGKEESSMSSTMKRGLAAGSDCQEYIMFINPSTRLKYDAFLEHIKEAKMLENESLTFVGQLKQEFVGRHDRLLKPGSNSLLDGQKAVNSLLKNFVKLMQTTYKDTHILEPTFVQRMLEIPPSDDEVPHATLWTDDVHHTWTSVLFEGIEFDLILFDIYVFTLFDMLAKQPVIALLCTFLLQKAVNFLRHELGIRNLGEKTLIGDRFFI